MKTGITALIFFLVFPGASFAQEQACTITFQPVYGNAALELNGAYFKTTQKDSLQITQCRFYISNLELLNSETTVWKETGSYHLIDLENEASLQISNVLPAAISYDQIRFRLGIDSLTNVSGAMGGDLDPARGMYWSWQSGYIHFKLEGKSNLCPTRNNVFQFHLGGYQSPCNSSQIVTLDIKENREIHVLADLQALLKNIDLAQQNQAMSPGSESVLLMKTAATIFSIE